MTTSFFVNNGGNTSARETISADLTASTNAKNDAEKYAVHPEDATFTLSDGVTTGKSALHYQAKAEDSQQAAAQSEANASASAAAANTAKLAAQAAEAAVSGASSGYVTETGSQTISGVKTFTTNPVFSSGLTVASLVSNGAVTPDSIGMADDKIIGFGASEDRGNNYNGVAQGNHFDLEIFHNGSNSYIKDYGTGNLAIEATELSLRDNSDNRRVYCTNGSAGGVQLYYGDTSNTGSKLNTTNTGVNISGTLNADSLDIDGTVDIDTGNAVFDVNTGSDNAIFTSSNHGRQFQIICTSSVENACPDLVLRKANDTTGDDEFNSGNIRFENAHNDGFNTHAYATITSHVVDQGASETDRTEADAQIRFAVMDGNDSSTALKNPQNRLLVNKNGIVVNSSNSSTGAEVLNVLTTSHAGIGVTGTVTADGLSLGDGEFGLFNGNLKIQSVGDNSYIDHIDTNSSKLFVRAEGATHIKSLTANKLQASFEDSEVSLWHDNNKVLATKNGGVTVTGKTESDKVEVGSPATTGAAVLAVEADTTSLNPVSISNSRNTASTDYSVIFYRNTNIVGSIQTTLSATSYLTASDYRLKNNVTYDWDATSRLKQLKPARFEFVSEPGVTVDGFLAHEVSGAVPEAVTGVKDETDDAGYAKYQGIDQSKLVPLLVKTIQELEARITALES